MRIDMRPMRFISVLVLIAVVNVFVFASGAVNSKTNESGSNQVLFGKLVTMSNRPILVNGGEAITGTTILSGAQLVTPAGRLATVQVDKIATLTIAPSSSVMLNFDSTTVTVKIAAGDATLKTVDGVKGTVVGPNGAPVNAPAPRPTDAETARNWGIAGVAIGSVGFIWALIAWNKANDANDKADALAAQLAALRACLAGQSATSPISRHD
jgi:hypothetical protein